MKKSKTKLLWAISLSGLEKEGVEKVAQRIADHEIDSVTLTYNASALELIKSLRSAIDSALLQKGNPGAVSGGMVPFIFSLCGRKASLSLPQEEGTLSFKTNEKIKIVVRVDSVSCSKMSFARTQELPEILVSSPDQLKTLRPGSQLSISFDSVIIQVTEVVQRQEDKLLLDCLVIDGGNVTSGMDVHSEDIPRTLFPLLPEDELSLKSKFANLADYVLLNGVEKEEEFFTLRREILGDNVASSLRHPNVAINKDIRQTETNIPPRFIFKIDSKNSLDLLPKITKYIDGVLLSRSELSVDVNIHDIPIIQKNLIKFCNDNSKIIIVASELMNSMRCNPNPTRAEVSDMANAVADGADALFLSHEVTEGPHADLVASFSTETLLNSEIWLEEKKQKFTLNLKTEDDALIYGALRIAEEAKAKAIVCFTEGGYTAIRLSATRSPTHIIAVTYNKKIMRQLNLLRSVCSLLINSTIEVEKILAAIKEILTTQLDFKKGEKFIFISLTSSSLGERNSNLFSIQEIE